VVNAVKEVADFVGDVVRPVADAAADVLRPVGEAILRSDEVKTVVNVAAVATGNAWAVPIINGADAIDEGADPEDVLKTIVISTVAAGAADAVGDVVAQSITDQVGDTVANFVADTGVNVVTNGGDIGAAVFDAGLKGSQIVSNTTNTIVDSLGIDTSTDLGKSLDKSLKTGISAEIMGEDGVKAASISAISDTIINPVLAKGEDLTPEALGDVSKLVSTALVAGAKGENVYDAINQELGNTATADLRDLVKTKVKDFIDPVEELPMDTGEFLTEAVLPDAETLDKFRDKPDTSVTESDLPYSPQNLQAPFISEEERQKFLNSTGIDLGKPSDIAKLMDDYEKRVSTTSKSLSEQEILDDPKTFKGPTGAGIGPEVTDEDYQSQLAGILGKGDEKADAAALRKQALLAPYKQLANDFRLNLSSGALEELALSAGGTGRGLDEFAEFLDRSYGVTGSGPLSLGLAATDVIEGLTGYDVNPIDKTKFAQRTYFKNISDPIKKSLLEGSTKLSEAISPEMAERQRLAAPAPDTTLEQVLRGEAKDVAGRPFGFGDPLATFMSASQDLPDILSDVALIAINPIIGGAASLGLSGTSAYEDAAQEIEDKIKKARASGELQKTDAYKLLVEKNGGDESKAYEQLQDSAQGYAKIAGTVGGIADAVFGKLAITSGIKNKAGKIPSAFSKVIGGAGTEFTTEYNEKKLANLGTKFLGTDPTEGAAAEGLSAMVAGGTGSSITATADLVSKDISPADKEAWIRTIIGEAAGESDEGQAAVAHTILNRFKDGNFGDSLKKVVEAPYQFSTYNSLDQGGNTLHKKSKSSPEYKRAEKLTNDILSGKIKDPTEGATHYWNPDAANPSWGDEILSQHKSGGKKIDSHIFGGNTAAVETVDVAEVADNIDKKPTVPTTSVDVLDTGQVDAEPEVDVSAEVVAEILNKPKNFVTDSDVDVVTDAVASLETATDTTTDITTEPTTTTTTTTTPTVTTTTTTPSLDIPVAPDQGIAQLAGARQVTLDPPEVADIDYLYDFSSIFANPEQEKLFTSPYKNFTTERDVFDNLNNDDRMRQRTPYERTTDDILDILKGVA